MGTNRYEGPINRYNKEQRMRPNENLKGTCVVRCEIVRGVNQKDKEEKMNVEGDPSLT